MQDSRKAVRSFPYVSVAFFPSLKQNFIAYRSSSRPDCIFEIHQQWQSRFKKVYSNCYCSCSFEPKIIKIGLSSHKMYSNNMVNCSRLCDNSKCLYKMYGILLNTPRGYIYIYIYIYSLSLSLTHTHTHTHIYIYIYIYIYILTHEYMQVGVYSKTELQKLWNA